MKKTKNKYLIWVALLLGCTHAGAQIEQVVASNGNLISGSNGQVSYTVGEPVTATLTSAGNAISQGYQQSNMSITAINDIAYPAYQVSVYPNPVTSQVTVYIKG